MQAPPRMSPEPSRSRLWIVSASFVVLLSLPLLVTLGNLATGAGTPSEERMAPAPRLPASIGEALRLPGTFKWYFSERFGLKQWLRGLHGWFESRVLQTSPSSSVLLGDSGWLFLQAERALDYHRHSDPLDDARLAEWAGILAQRQRMLEARGIRHAFVVAPNKHSIYPDRLPKDLAPQATTTRLDQLLATTKRLAPQVTLIDLRPPLAVVSKEVPLFFRTDTHWTAAGSWVGAQHIARVLGVTPPPSPLQPVRILPTTGGDLARLIGLAAETPDDDVWPAAAPLPLVDEQGRAIDWKLMDVSPRDRIVALNAAGKGTAVVFRDSFGEALIPWISSMFGRTVWLWSYEFSLQDVEAERPDVVLEEIVERKLMVIKSPGGGVDG